MEQNREDDRTLDEGSGDAGADEERGERGPVQERGGADDGGDGAADGQGESLAVGGYELAEGRGDVHGRETVDEGHGRAGAALRRSRKLAAKRVRLAVRAALDQAEWSPETGFVGVDLNALLDSAEEGA